MQTLSERQKARQEAILERYKDGELGDLRKSFTNVVKGVDEQKRTARFVISTGNPDRDKDVIEPKGWVLKDFKTNPVVLWAHQSGQPPVARASATSVQNGKLMSTATFMSREISEFADSVFKMIVNKFLNASSVGFQPLELSFDEERGGFNFIKQALHEWSVVPVPANAEALVGAKSMGINVEPILDWAKFTLDHYSREENAMAAYKILRAPQVQVVTEDLPDEVNVTLGLLDATGDEHIKAALLAALTKGAEETEDLSTLDGVGDPPEPEPQGDGDPGTDDNDSAGDKDLDSQVVVIVEADSGDSGGQEKDAEINLDPDELRKAIQSTVSEAMAAVTGGLPD